MKKEKYNKNQDCYKLYHEFAIEYARQLCKLEFLIHKYILKDNKYSILDFKNSLRESFVYSNAEISNIYNNEFNKHKEL